MKIGKWGDTEMGEEKQKDKRRGAEEMGGYEEEEKR